MKMRVLGVAVAALVAATPAIASAGHEHFLVTPGTCVEDIASGQTGISDSAHGGYHRFHVNVHQGAGGADGPLNRNGVAPVIVDKTEGGNLDSIAECSALQD